MQEPLTKGREHNWDPQYVLDQATVFVQLMRANYPGIQLVSIEAYPYLSASSIQYWIEGLNLQCQSAGVQPPDYFELDHFWSLPYGQWTWGDIRDIQTWAQTYFGGFGVIFITDPPDDTNNLHWYAGVNTQGSM
jgi:hypothetical protein